MLPIRSYIASVPCFCGKNESVISLGFYFRRVDFDCRQRETVGVME